MKTLTTTDKTPIFVTNKHYQIAGTTNPDQVYDLIYNETFGRWVCSCPDAQKNYNPNCKHRRKLVEHIKAQMASRVQQEATAVVEQPSEIEALAEMVSKLQEQVCSLQEQVKELQETKANKRKPRAKKAAVAVSGEQPPDTTGSSPSFAEALLHKAHEAIASVPVVTQEPDMYTRLADVELTQEEMEHACRLLGIEVTKPEAKRAAKRETATLSSNRGFSLMRQ